MLIQWKTTNLYVCQLFFLIKSAMDAEWVEHYLICYISMF